MLEEHAETRKGSRIATSPAVLIVLEGNHVGKRYLLRGSVTIGRALDCSICLREDDEVSRKHAVISRDSRGRWHVQDLKSRNGIQVNGYVVKRERLVQGDRIRLGTSTTLLFTRLDAYEMRALRSQNLEAVGRMARGVAHDFNNMLSAITLGLGYLRAHPEVAQDALLLECVEDLDAAANHGKGLVQILRNISSERVNHAALIDIGELADEALRGVRPMGSRIQFMSSDISRQLFIRGDATPIRQVFTNLMVNAIQAMPEGGILRVETGVVPRDSELRAGLPPGSWVFFTVGDTGPGMDSDTLERVFEPFFTTRTATGGTGVGLAIVHGIVKAHGGVIDVETGPGEGATFSVYLPLPGGTPVDGGTDDGDTAPEQKLNLDG